MGEVWVGIDVSKRTLDASLADEGKARARSCKAANGAKGFAKILGWALALAKEGERPRFCMEATGDYGVELALWLLEMGYRVSVVNPAKVRYYGICKGRLNKTDRADARLIAEYAERMDPAPWELTDPDRRALFRLSRRRSQLVRMESAEMSRRECPGAVGPACVASIEAMLRAIRQEIRQIEAQARRIIEASAELSQAAELIQSLPPLGFGSALTILSEMPPAGLSASAKEWAASAGVSPTTRQSGTSVAAPGSISKQGRRHCRGRLWMPALSGLSQMPELRALYDRLIAKGRHHFQALTACLRKLLMIAYGVLKHKTPYKPREAPSAAPA